MKTGGRVILVTLSEPHPFGHVLGRWYYAFLKELSRRNYEVRCLSATTNEAWAVEATKAMAPLGVRLSLHPLEPESNWFNRKWRTFRRPFSYTISNGLRVQLAKEIRVGYDVLHMEQLWTGYLADGHPRSLVAVHHLSSVDLKGLKFTGSAGSVFRKHLICRSENRLLRCLKTITTLSGRLATSIQTINPQARVFVVPFGLDASLYEFSAEDRSHEPVIGFLANMGWMPGYLAARRLITSIFPRVKQLVPEARLLVGGWNAREVLAEFTGLPGVTIAGDVSDAQSYFERLRILAYPVPQGSGVKVKVLEAMAWGIPVITTTDGVEGINAIDGEHCFIADDDAAFAQRIVEVLGNEDVRRRLRQRARALIEEQHSPLPVVNRLEQVYQVL